mmetsp:Transcript_423/g.498  ORF Transcript_423/g.498 Transcript_423/m.498 type:complete len:104 (+) Transcript_423:58-369(+)
MFAKRKEEGPGPGQYNVQHAFDHTKAQAPEWSFLDSSPFEQNRIISKDDVNRILVPPGPGHYKSVISQTPAKVARIYTSDRPNTDWGDAHVSLIAWLPVLANI